MIETLEVKGHDWCLTSPRSSVCLSFVRVKDRKVREMPVKVLRSLINWLISLTFQLSFTKRQTLRSKSVTGEYLYFDEDPLAGPWFYRFLLFIREDKGQGPEARAKLNQ